jgi:hypothetical protein
MRKVDFPSEKGRKITFSPLKIRLSTLDLRQDAEEKVMGSKDFWDILLETVHKDLAKEKARFSSGKAISPSENLSANSWSPRIPDLEPAGMAQLLGVLPKTDLSIHSGSLAYRRFHKPPPPRAPHKFTPDQQLSYEWFRENGAELAPNFALRELKSAFRCLALRYHPDVYRGPAEKFLSLRECYQKLQSVF